MSFQYLKLSSLALACAFVFNTQAVLAENVISQAAKEKAKAANKKGGADTGGGHMVSREKFLKEMDEQNILDFIQIAKMQLPRVFRAFEYLEPGYIRFSDENGRAPEDVKEKYLRGTMIHALNGGQIYPLIRKLNFLAQEAPCKNSRGEDEDASVFNMSENDVCISVGRILEATKSNRISKSDTYLQILALMAHEALHKAGITLEVLPRSVQWTILLNFEYSRAFSGAYSNSKEALEFASYYANEISRRIEKLREEIDQARQLNDFELLCDEMEQSVKYIEDTLSKIRNRESSHFALINKNGYGNLVSAIAVNLVNYRQFCKSAQANMIFLKREEQVETNWKILLSIRPGEKLPMNEVVANIKLNNVITGVEYKNIPQMKEQLEYMSQLLIKSSLGVTP